MLSKHRLELHYNTKYQAEASNTCVPTLEYKVTPSNRFEACLKYFFRHFKGGNILELGAGSGLIAQSLITHRLPFDTYTLSEQSNIRMQGLLQRFKDPRIQVVKLDAESIPESEFAKYDAVIMLALIEHLIDPLGAMQQVKQLLQPGGFVFIETPNIAKFTRRVKLLLGRFPSTASRNEGLATYEGNPVDLHDEGHLHYFTYRSLSLMLIQRCGFSKVENSAYFVGPNGQRVFGHRFGAMLAHYWPQLFSEIIVVAYA